MTIIATLMFLLALVLELLVAWLFPYVVQEFSIIGITMKPDGPRPFVSPNTHFDGEVNNDSVHNLVDVQVSLSRLDLLLNRDQPG